MSDFKCLRHNNHYYYFWSLLFLLLYILIPNFSRALVYMFPFNIIEWVKRVLLAGIMSVCIGTIYLGVRWQYWNASFLQRESEDDDLFQQANIGGKWKHVM